MFFLYHLIRTTINNLLSSDSDNSTCYLRATPALWLSCNDLEDRNVSHFAFAKISCWSSKLMTSCYLDIITRSVLHDLVIHKNPNVENTFLKTKGHLVKFS